MVNEYLPQVTLKFSIWKMMYGNKKKPTIVALQLMN
jgi:hypothetical protein